jgi:hypothetical protein
MPVLFGNSQKREITPLISLKVDTMPWVFYTIEAWKTIEYLVSKSPDEIGWFGLVDNYDNGNYCITEILVPKQEVTGASVDIEANAIAEVVNQLLNEGKDPSKLRYHGHSHVDMKVMPSGTDQEHLEEYMEDCDWFIRGIYNKHRDSKVDVFDKQQQCVFQCVDTDILENLRDDAFYDNLDRVMKEQVSKRQFKSFSKPGTSLVDPRFGLKNKHYSYFDDSLDDIDTENAFYREALKDPFYAGKP